VISWPLGAPGGASVVTGISRTKEGREEVKIYAGTSGYSYKEWKGNFYPEKLPAREMLAHYAQQLPTVEINNTFYRVPKKSVFENWAAQVGDDFRFIVKATQRITHFKRLRNAAEEVQFFMGQAQTLGDRLGAVLFQMPPSFKKDASVLAEFLDTLPDDARAAFEFRHNSWFEDDVFELLRGRNCALCIADAEDGADVPFESTADWGYLRLRRPGYETPELESWLDRIRGQAWDRAYVFFKHEEAGAGPAMARRLLDLTGS
jgi:uncharacterized protein YecE (DUF72 family)